MNRIIEQFVQNVVENEVVVDSIFVEQNGKVDEKILNDTKLHELRSCSKVLVTFAYGIAINEKFKCKDGKILTLETEVYSTFSKLVDRIPEEVKKWTIRTLLTHSTGYETMLFNKEHVATLDEFKLLDALFLITTKYQPNTHFTYSNVEPYLLSIFFKENFDVDISDFVNERIFKPLQIENFIWENLGNYCAGATGLYLNHKDFHKIGKLLFGFGKYNGKQIVPENWVREMTKPQFECNYNSNKVRVLPKLQAGYYCWISRDEIVFRDGSNGQYIICDYKNSRLITIMSSHKDMRMVLECLRGLF